MKHGPPECRAAPRLTMFLTVAWVADAKEEF
jgi:hypothetical protein